MLPTDYESVANLTNDELLDLRGNLSPEQYLTQYLNRQLPGTYLVLREWTGERNKGSAKLHNVECLCGRVTKAIASNLTYKQSRANLGWKAIGKSSCRHLDCQFAQAPSRAQSQATFNMLQTYLPDRAQFSLVRWEPGKRVNGKLVKYPTVYMTDHQGRTVDANMADKLWQLSGRQAIQSAKQRATQQRRPIDLDYLTEWVTTLWQPGNQLLCEYTGLPLTYLAKGEHALTPSIDKIIPDLGYVPGNLTLCSKLANNLKNDFSLPELKQQLANCNNTYTQTLQAVVTFLESNPQASKTYDHPFWND